MRPRPGFDRFDWPYSEKSRIVNSFLTQSLQAAATLAGGEFPPAILCKQIKTKCFESLCHHTCL